MINNIIFKTKLIEKITRYDEYHFLYNNIHIQDKIDIIIFITISINKIKTYSFLCKLNFRNE